MPAPSNEATPAPANGVQLPPLSSALGPSAGRPSGFAAIDNPVVEEREANGDTEMAGR